MVVTVLIWLDSLDCKSNRVAEMMAREGQASRYSKSDAEDYVQPKR